MAGGTWETQNKERPGVYINFATRATASLNIGERGVVAIAKVLSWGAVGELQIIESGTDTTNATGYDITHAKNLFIRQMFTGTNRTSGAQKILLYRLATAGSAQASATIGNLTITAKYAGIRGNDISVSVTADPDTEGSFFVSTMIDGMTVDIQSGATVADLTENEWVQFSGNGELEANTGTALTGGNDGTLSATAYTSFLNALEMADFDVVTYDGSDTTVQASFISFVKRIADGSGKYTQLVTANATAPDSRFVINNMSGATLDDGTTLTPQEVCWWIAGATAGAKYNQSLTYAVYPSAVKVSPPLTNSQYIAAIEAGQFMLFEDGGQVKVETDINSLTTYTQDIGKVYSKNRVIRLCNTIANDIYRQFSNNYIGVVNNNEDGRSLFRAAIIQYLLEIQANNGIQNFTAEDVEVTAGAEIDAIVVNLAIQPVDAIEKIYMTVTVG